MLKIKLQRKGKKHQPHYRIVISDTNSPKKVIEFLGSYDPKLKTKQIKAERVNYWIGEGAKISDTVHNMLIKERIIKGKKISKHSISKKEEKEENK